MGAAQQRADGPLGRFSAVSFVARLMAAVTLPLVLVGVGLWWLVGTDRVGDAVELAARHNDRLVDVALGDVLAFEQDTVRIPDPAALAVARARLLDPVLGAHQLRIVAPDGRILHADATGQVGLVADLGDADRRALQGVPAGARVGGTGRERVTYSLPLARDGGPTVAVAQLTVVDDAAVAATVAASGELAYLFAGAFLALLLVLGPLCWWSLGQVRRQFRRTRVLALRDTLTGLANRTAFHDRLAEAVAGAQRGNGRVGLIMLDLDGFKAINDTGGHAAGDRLLKRVAAGLEETTRRDEMACRLGGDEFAVVVPRLGSREELVALADRLHERLDLQVDFSDGRSLRVTASMGLAVFPDDAVVPDDLVTAADLGMYNVKAARKAKLPSGGRRNHPLAT